MNIIAHKSYDYENIEIYEQGISSDALLWQNPCKQGGL